MKMREIADVSAGYSGLFMPPSKRKEMRTALALSVGLAIAMFTFVMVAKSFLAGSG